MTEFKNKVTMRVTREQYEKDLEKPLEELGYTWDSNDSEDFDEWDILSINIDNNAGMVCIDAVQFTYKVDESLFIENYDPQLFLTLASARESDNIFTGEDEELNNLPDLKEVLNSLGYKESSGKLNYELDWDFIEEMAKCMALNKSKYPPYNWKKPCDIEKLKQALFRHVLEVMRNNYNDNNIIRSHFSSIALNSMMINYQLREHGENLSNL